MDTKEKKKIPRTHDTLMKHIEAGVFRKPAYTPQYNLVLRELADRTNSLKKHAFPSVANISMRTWISVSQVRKIIGVLERDGFLHVTRRPEKSSLYRIIMPPGDASANGTPLVGAVAPSASPHGLTPTERAFESASEHSQTVKLIGKENGEMNPEAEPGRAAPVFSTREDTERDKNDNNNSNSSNPYSPSENALELSRCLKSVFQDAYSNPNDFEQLSGLIKKEELLAVLEWAKFKSNGPWRNTVTSSGYLVTWFDMISGQFRKFYRLEENAPLVVPDSAQRKVTRKETVEDWLKDPTYSAGLDGSEVI